MDINKAFSDFEQRWELTHHKPTKNKDIVLTISLFVLTGGAALLAGSRTGTAIADLEVLTNFGNSIIKLPDGIWKSFEALLGFATIEVGIFASGYLTSVVSTEPISKRWYLYLTICALLTSVVANINPAFSDTSLAEVSNMVVNITVGLAAPAMLFISGKVAGAIKQDLADKYSEELTAWEDSKRNAWTSSTEYRGFRKGKTKQEKSVELTTLEAKIIGLVEKGQISIEEVVDKLDVPEVEVTDSIFNLVAKNKLKRSGQLLDI